MPTPYAVVVSGLMAVLQVLLLAVALNQILDSL